MVTSSWIFPGSLEQAALAQREMAQKVSLEKLDLASIRYVAGMDISNTPFDPEQMVFGAVVVLSYPDLKVVETSTCREKQEFPYIPGFLGFREVPTLYKAYRQLSIQPDVILVDGHGVSHPRGLGVASHIGVALDVPTVGVAKSILVGKAKEALPDEPGSTIPLVWKGKEIGVLLRSKKRVLPLVVSPGNKIDAASALQLVSSCLKGYRLPEPTRQAHLAANAARKINSL